MQFVIDRASAVDISMTWERSYIVSSLTWRWPSARCIGVAGPTLYEEAGAGVGGVGNDGSVQWPGGALNAYVVGVLDGGGDSLGVNVGLHQGVGSGFLLFMKVVDNVFWGCAWLAAVSAFECRCSDSGCRGWGGVRAKTVGMEVRNGGVGAVVGLMLQGLRRWMGVYFLAQLGSLALVIAGCGVHGQCGGVGVALLGGHSNLRATHFLSHSAFNT